MLTFYTLDEKDNIFIYKGTTDLKDMEYYVEKGDTIKVTGFIKEHISMHLNLLISV